VFLLLLAYRRNVLYELKTIENIENKLEVAPFSKEISVLITKKISLFLISWTEMLFPIVLGTSSIFLLYTVYCILYTVFCILYSEISPAENLPGFVGLRERII